MTHGSALPALMYRILESTYQAIVANLENVMMAAVETGAVVLKYSGCPRFPFTPARVQGPLAVVWILMKLLIPARTGLVTTKVPGVSGGILVAS